MRKCTMANAMRKTSGVSGIGDMLKKRYNWDETRESSYSEVWRDSLKSASTAARFELNDIQTLAISKLVRLDSSHVTFNAENGIFKYRTPLSDFQRPSILDLPAGTGKTLVSILGGILFAIERNEDMEVIPPVIQEWSSGCIPIGRSFRTSNRICLSFVAKQLCVNIGNTKHPLQRGL